MQILRKHILLTPGHGKSQKQNQVHWTRTILATLVIDHKTFLLSFINASLVVSEDMLLAAICATDRDHLSNFGRGPSNNMSVKFDQCWVSGLRTDVV